MNIDKPRGRARGWGLEEEKPQRENVLDQVLSEWQYVEKTKKSRRFREWKKKGKSARRLGKDRT